MGIGILPSYWTCFHSSQQFAGVASLEALRSESFEKLLAVGFSYQFRADAGPLSSGRRAANVRVRLSTENLFDSRDAPKRKDVKRMSNFGTRTCRLECSQSNPEPVRVLESLSCTEMSKVKTRRTSLQNSCAHERPRNCCTDVNLSRGERSNPKHKSCHIPWNLLKH